MAADWYRTGSGTDDDFWWGVGCSRSRKWRKRSRWFQSLLPWIRPEQQGIDIRRSWKEIQRWRIKRLSHCHGQIRSPWLTQEKDIPQQKTIRDLQGNTGKKYLVSFQLGPKNRRTRYTGSLDSLTTVQPKAKWHLLRKKISNDLEMRGSSLKILSLSASIAMPKDTVAVNVLIRLKVCPWEI